MTFSAFLGQLTAARKRLILGILQFILQLINLDKVVLDTVTIGNIHNQKGRNKQKHAYLMSYGLRSQHVTAKDFLECEMRSKRRFVFCGLLCYHLFQRSAFVIC